MGKYITGFEARKLAEASDAAVDIHLEKISAQIRLAAEGGVRVLPIYTYTPETSMPLWRSVPLNEAPMPNLLQERIISKLRALGFNVSFGPHGDNYVPRGLQNDNGNGPTYVNHCIVVNW